MSEDALAIEELYLREVEAYVARQVVMVFELERHGHMFVAKSARKLLATMWDTLRFARGYVEQLRELRGLGLKCD